jgi:hypothetical protein
MVVGAEVPVGQVDVAAATVAGPWMVVPDAGRVDRVVVAYLREPGGVMRSRRNSGSPVTGNFGSTDLPVTRTRHGGGDGRVHGPPVGPGNRIDVGDRDSVYRSASRSMRTQGATWNAAGTTTAPPIPMRACLAMRYVAVRPGCIAAVSLRGLPNGQEACWAGLSPASGGASSRHPAAPPRQALARISADARPGQGCTLDLPVCPPACASTSQRWPSVRMYTSRRPSELRFPFHQWRSILTY